MDLAPSTSSEGIYLGTDVRCVRHLQSHTGVLQSTQSWQHLIVCAEWCPDTQVQILSCLKLLSLSNPGFSDLFLL